jgi:hypothetical protein
VRLNSLRFGYDLRAAVISIISNPKFKGLARVSLITPRTGCEEQPISRVTMKLSGAARQSVVSLLAELDLALKRSPLTETPLRSVRSWQGQSARVH